MKKHRRKIALAVALALLFGSAAASAANYSAGRGAMPSFAGASDALDLAASGVASSANWIITRARNSVGSAFSYQPTTPARPPEVANPPSELPMYSRGLPRPIDVDPHWPATVPTTALATPEAVQNAPTFDDGVAGARTAGVASIATAGLSLPSLPGTGGGGTVASRLLTTTATPSTPTLTPRTLNPTITTAVPELPPYAMLVAGLGLLAAFRRRQA